MIKKRSLIIGAIATLLLIGGMVFLLMYQPEGAKKPEDVSLEVTKFNYEDIASVDIKNENDSYTVLTEGETPAIQGEDSSLYNGEGIKALVNLLSNITAVKVLDKEEASLENLGLATPRATATIHLKDSSVVTLFLGAKNTIDNSCYLMKEGDDHLYTAEEVVETCMLMAKVNYRDMTMITGADDEAVRLLRHITVFRREGENTKKMVLEQLPFKEEDTLITYKMIEPVISNLDWEAVNNKIVDKINALKGDGILANDADLAKYGLDNPEYTLELDYTTGTERVFFTSSPDPAYVVAAVEGKNTIYLLSSEKIDFIKSDYTSIIGKSAYIRNATTVKRMTVSANGKTIDLEVTGDAAMVEAKLNGAAIDQNAFMSFYLTATQIPLIREMTPADPTSGVVQMEIVFYLRDGSKDVVELLALSDRQSAVRINGQISFVTYTKIIEDIFNSYLPIEVK